MKNKNLITYQNDFHIKAKRKTFLNILKHTFLNILNNKLKPKYQNIKETINIPNYKK